MDSEVKSKAELTVGIPKDNLTILGLARQFGSQIKGGPAQADSKARLKSVTRYQPVSVEHTWALTNTKSRGVETLSWQIPLR